MIHEVKKGVKLRDGAMGAERVLNRRGKKAIFKSSLFEAEILVH